MVLDNSREGQGQVETAPKCNNCTKSNLFFEQVEIAGILLNWFFQFGVISNQGLRLMLFL
jgi:hypothetical protein